MLSQGGDVKGDLRGEGVGASQTIPIGAIRHSHSSTSNLEADAVLHRVILKDYGIPLYEFRTVTEMLYAVSAVVKGMTLIASWMESYNAENL